MAVSVVHAKRMSIHAACIAFSISETCYRYQAKLSSENAVIADWLIRLTTNQRNWGFVLFLPAQYQTVSLEPQAGLQNIS